jgi:hypothetical protein
LRLKKSTQQFVGNIFFPQAGLTTPCPKSFIEFIKKNKLGDENNFDTQQFQKIEAEELQKYHRNVAALPKHKIKNKEKFKNQSKQFNQALEKSDNPFIRYLQF